MTGARIFGLTNLLVFGALCNEWVLRMPEQMDILSGSCAVIPCQFELPASFESNLSLSTVAMWKKGSIHGAAVLTSDKTKPSAIQGHVLGKITEKNCTTRLDSLSPELNGTYFLRLEGTEPLKYTFPKGITINIHKGSAPRPRLRPMGHTVEVVAGQKVTLSCFAKAPCPSRSQTLRWNPQLEEQAPTTEWVDEDGDGVMSLVSSQSFTVTPLIHNLKVTCSATYFLPNGGVDGTSSSSTVVSVLYAPQNTLALAFPPGPVPPGRAVTLTCQAEANPEVQRYAWYRETGTGELVWRGAGQSLTLVANPSEGGLYLCEAHNPRGKNRSRAIALEIEVQQCSVVPYVICGVLAAFFTLTVGVDLYKYKSLSSRLKIEVSREPNMYATLDMASVSSHYDQIQRNVRGPDMESDYTNGRVLNPA